MLGVVQGVAEVLPVSSSAQLHLLPWLLGASPADHRTALAAGLHAGSCLGIGLALQGEVHARDLPLLALASVPAGVAGLALGELVERRLGRPGPTAVLLAVGGVALALADRRPGERRAGRTDVVLAGVAQVLALAPGVSRSGATLTLLRARRVEPESAFVCSLLLSLPVTAGAAVVASRGRARDPALLTGVPVAALVSFLTTRAVRGRVHTALTRAALYRLALAAVVLRRLTTRPQEHL